MPRTGCTWEHLAKGRKSGSSPFLKKRTKKLLTVSVVAEEQFLLTNKSPWALFFQERTACLLNERVTPPLGADRRTRAMPTYEAVIIAQWTSSFDADGVDQRGMITIRKIRAADREPWNSTSPTWANFERVIDEDDMAGRMARDSAARRRHGWPTLTLWPSAQPAIGCDVLQIHASRYMGALFGQAGQQRRITLVRTDHFDVLRPRAARNSLTPPAWSRWPCVSQMARTSSLSGRAQQSPPGFCPRHHAWIDDGRLACVSSSQISVQFCENGVTGTTPTRRCRPSQIRSESGTNVQVLRPDIIAPRGE